MNVRLIRSPESWSWYDIQVGDGDYVINGECPRQCCTFPTSTLQHRYATISGHFSNKLLLGKCVQSQLWRFSLDALSYRLHRSNGPLAQAIAKKNTHYNNTAFLGSNTMRPKDSASSSTGGQNNRTRGRRTRRGNGDNRTNSQRERLTHCESIFFTNQHQP